MENISFTCSHNDNAKTGKHENKAILVNKETVKFINLNNANIHDCVQYHPYRGVVMRGWT